MKRVLGILAIICSLFYGIQVYADQMTIKEGSKVSLEYTLTVDEQVVDTSVGKEPLQYVQGSKQIIPGLESELAGLKVGDEKTVTVQPKDGYGEVNLNAFQEVQRSALPLDVEPQVGMMLEMTDTDGNSFPASITKVEKDKITVDFNHPLAGKTLHFKIKILKIE